MSTPFRRTPPVTTMVLGFLALAAAATLFGLGARYGIIAPTASRRAIGAVIGVMFIVTGNFLPKMRPLNTPATEPTKATAAERVAGWILVLVGFADIALFMLARLEVARTISSVIGIGAIAVIAANWAWLARGLLFGRGQTVGGETTLYRAPSSLAHHDLAALRDLLPVRDGRRQSLRQRSRLVGQGRHMDAAGIRRLLLAHRVLELTPEKPEVRVRPAIVARRQRLDLGLRPRRRGNQSLEPRIAAQRRERRIDPQPPRRQVVRHLQ